MDTLLDKVLDPQPIFVSQYYGYFSVTVQRKGENI